jgi:hypothetical protein
MFTSSNLRRTFQDSRDLASGLKEVRFAQLSVDRLSQSLKSARTSRCLAAAQNTGFFPVFLQSPRSRPLSRDLISVRNSPQNSPSGGQSETNTLGVSGLCRVDLGLTPTAGSTTLGNSLSDSLGTHFFGWSDSLSNARNFFCKIITTPKILLTEFWPCCVNHCRRPHS